jgi:hypothetical protein
VLLATLAPHRFRASWSAAALAGCAAGFLLGAPHVFVKLPEMWKGVADIIRGNMRAPAEYAYSWPALLGAHSLNVIRFLLGPVAAALSVAGLVSMIRRRDLASSLLLCVAAGILLLWVALAWPLLRYELPMLAVLALAAGIMLAGLPPRLQFTLGMAALIFPVAASIAQVHYMRSTPPVNEALDVILRTVPPNTPISRMVAELPPLDRKVYPMGPNPFMRDITVDPPQWVLTADLPDTDYPSRTREMLQTRYERVGEFGIPRILAWATLGEARVPHDWKYTHNRLALYRRLQ